MKELGVLDVPYLLKHYMYVHANHLSAGYKIEINLGGLSKLPVFVETVTSL